MISREASSLAIFWTISRHAAALAVILVASVLAALIQGCNAGGRTDKNGNTSEAVAAAFVEAVNAGDLQRAAKFWAPNAIRHVELNWGTNFAELCTNQFNCESFELLNPRRGKAGYYLLTFRGKTSTGEVKVFGLGLRMTDDEWLLDEDLWRSEGR